MNYFGKYAHTHLYFYLLAKNWIEPNLPNKRGISELQNIHTREQYFSKCSLQPITELQNQFGGMWQAY